MSVTQTDTDYTINTGLSSIHHFYIVAQSLATADASQTWSIYPNGGAGGANKQQCGIYIAADGSTRISFVDIGTNPFSYSVYIKSISGGTVKIRTGTYSSYCLGTFKWYAD